MNNTLGLKYLLWVGFIITALLLPLACKQKSKVFFGAGSGYAECGNSALYDNKSNVEEAQESISNPDDIVQLRETKVAPFQKKTGKVQQPHTESKFVESFVVCTYPKEKVNTNLSEQKFNEETPTSHNEKGFLLFLIPILGMLGIGVSKLFSFKKLRLWAARNPKAGQLSIAGLACGTYATGVLMAEPLTDLGIASSQAFTYTMIGTALSSLIAWRMMLKKRVSPSKRSQIQTLLSSLILASTFGLSVDLGLQSETHSLLQPIWERNEASIENVNLEGTMQLEEGEEVLQSNKKPVFLSILFVLGIIALGLTMLIITLSISCNLLCDGMVFLGYSFLAVGGVFSILVPILLGLRYFRGPRGKREVAPA